MDQQEPFLNADVFNINDIAEIEGKKHPVKLTVREFLEIVSVILFYFRLSEQLRQ